MSDVLGGSSDDRKRGRESVKGEALKGVSPKKGKTGASTFTFPAFDAPLAEIAQKCKRGTQTGAVLASFVVV
jgi:hypothetical protein